MTSQRAPIESLEPRRLLAAVSWDGGGDGVTWADKNNWSNNLVPTSNDDVTINVAANPTIQIVGLQSIKSLNSSEKLHVAVGGDLRLAAASTINADVQVDAYLRSNVTLTINNATIQVGDTAGNLNGYLMVGNGTSQAQSITGNGTIRFGGSTSGNVIYNNSAGSAAAGTMTIGPNIKINGIGGRLANNYSSGTIVNQGLISAEDPLGAISVGSSTGKLENKGTIQALNGSIAYVNSTWTNTGVLKETNSTLNLGGTFTNASVGTVTRSGGIVAVTGAVNGGLNLNGSSGSWKLSNAIFTGGTINLTGAAQLIATYQGSTFDGVTINGDLDLTEDGAKITNKNTVTHNGTMRIGNAAGTTFGSLLVGSGSNTAQLLNGNSTIIFGGSANNFIRNDTTGAGAAGTLTIGSDVTIRGKNGIISNNLASGTIANGGLIAADVAGGTIVFKNVGTINNQGSIEAAPGTIQFDGGYSNVNGSMTIGFGGTSAGQSYGLFKIGGAFTAGGKINTVLLPNHFPPNNTTFNAISFASTAGSFAATRFDAGNGISFTPTVGATGMSFKAVTGGLNFANRTGDSMDITGTANADTLTLTREFDILIVTRNGATSVFRDQDVQSIDIDTGEGNDTITLHAGRVDNVNAGGGDDTLDVQDGRTQNVNGGAGNDTAVIDISDNLIDVENVPGGSITGFFWNDANSNGVKEAGESPLAGWTAYIDTNNNNVFDAGDFGKTSDAAGLYAFRGLPNGTYQIKQVLKSGYRKTLPGTGVPGYSQVIAGGNSAAGKNFGDTSNILLAGKVFNDANNNGVQDGGESGLAGVTVNIISNSTTVATRTTDASGAWQVKGLAAGSGEAVAVLPSGYTATSPAGAKYTGSMSAGQQNANLNFGLRKTSPAPAAVNAASVLTRILTSDRTRWSVEPIEQ